jgi:NADH-quinone oxidoreductase subunit M
MGTYGFLRFALPLFPGAMTHYSTLILSLGVIGIIYGALMAWMQEDAKKLVAYSSVSHLGFVVIGSVVLLDNKLSEEALTGALYQMINHGISTGALFFLVGMIYERRHTRNLSDFGGLATVMPWYALSLIIATLGSIGLPGTGGFVGEFLILLGVFNLNPTAGVLATSGVVLGAVYMLTMVMKILFGPISQEQNRKLPDMSLIEKAYMIPLCVLILIMGIFPNYFLDKTRASVRYLAENLSQYRLMTADEYSQANDTIANPSDEISVSIQ